MTQVKVWAPEAQSVELCVFEQRLPMSQQGEWWHAFDSRIQHGTRYQFSVNGGPSMPDPRSLYQPDGPHGASAFIDQTLFAWNDGLEEPHESAASGAAAMTGARIARFCPLPLRSAIVYEMHVGTFTEEGTFDSAVRRLDHLTSLGVTHLELMPVAEFPGRRGWGYDGVSLFAPHSGYGGPDGLKRLVNACHERGLAVLLDVVYNHLGPSGNYLAQFGPYFTDAYHTPWGKAVNLDQAGSAEVREFFFDNALMWLRDYHFDGLRLDAVHAYFDNGAYHFLEELADRVERFNTTNGRSCVLIAESDLADPRTTRSRDAFGHGMDAQWCDDLHHAIHAQLTGERDGYYADFGSITRIAEALQHGFVFRGHFSPFRNRKHGHPTQHPQLQRLFGYTQTHDQVGNRAQGDRLSQLLKPAQLKQAAAIVLGSPFIPMLFQGEEWAAQTPFCYFTDHDPELGKAVSEGRKREFSDFGWDPESIPDPQASATFERSKLNWAERKQSMHAEMLSFYRSLIALRRSIGDLRSAAIDVRFSEEERWLKWSRGMVSVLINLSDEPRLLPMPVESRLLLSAGEVVVGEKNVQLGSQAVAIVQTTDQ